VALTELRSPTYIVFSTLKSLLYDDLFACLSLKEESPTLDCLVVYKTEAGFPPPHRFDTRRDQYVFWEE